MTWNDDEPVLSLSVFHKCLVFWVQILIEKWNQIWPTLVLGCIRDTSDIQTFIYWQPVLLGLFLFSFLERKRRRKIDHQAVNQQQQPKQPKLQVHKVTKSSGQRINVKNKKKIRWMIQSFYPVQQQQKKSVKYIKDPKANHWWWWLWFGYSP